MESSILWFIAVGFLAQMIDGSLGMGFGVISNSVLLSLGVGPAAASASVHAAEIVTTGISGLSHHLFGNVDKDLFKRLVIPGIFGAVLGAYLVVAVPTGLIKPLVSVYLLAMGIMVLSKAFRRQLTETRVTTRIGRLGLIGAFCDAVGGGGWGPIVTSTLVARGMNTRLAIGSVNLSEFFVTIAASLTFQAAMGITHWTIIVGLIIGGAIGAPLSAYASGRLPRRALMVLVGTLIVALSLRNLARLL